MIKVSRQKIYNSLEQQEKKYGTLNSLAVTATYIPSRGLKLNYLPKEITRSESRLKNNTLDLTDCLRHNTKFEMADEMAFQIEMWLKNKEKKI